MWCDIFPYNRTSLCVQKQEKRKRCDKRTQIKEKIFALCDNITVHVRKCILNQEQKYKVDVPDSSALVFQSVRSYSVDVKANASGNNFENILSQFALIDVNFTIEIIYNNTCNFTFAFTLAFTHA